jgi:transposase InsO family protein
MPTKRSLAAYSYPEKEIQAFIGNPSEFQTKYSHFTIDNGKLTYRSKILVPAEQVHLKIKEEYQKSYMGVQKLHSLLQAKFIGISQRQVGEFLRNSQVQQQHTIAPTLRHTHPRALVSGKNKLVQLDVTIFHKTPLLGIIDVFTRRAAYYILTDQTAGAVTRVFQKYLTTHDMPSAILSDNGSEFLGEFSDFLKKTEIALFHGTPYNSQTQGIIERLHRSLKGGLERYKTDHGTDWRKFVNTWVNEYNKAKHASTGFSPDELHAADDESWKVKKATKCMQKSNENLTKRRAQLMPKFPELSTGDSVRLKRNRKKVLGKASEQRWTTQVYKITTKVGANYALEGQKGSFPRDSLLKIDLEKLIHAREKKKPTHVNERPKRRNQDR